MLQPRRSAVFPRGQQRPPAAVQTCDRLMDLVAASSSHASYESICILGCGSLFLTGLADTAIRLSCIMDMRKGIEPPLGENFAERGDTPVSKGLAKFRGGSVLGEPPSVRTRERRKRQDFTIFKTVENWSLDDGNPTLMGTYSPYFFKFDRRCSGQRSRSAMAISSAKLRADALQTSGMGI